MSDIEENSLAGSGRVDVSEDLTLSSKPLDANFVVDLSSEVVHQNNVGVVENIKDRISTLSLAGVADTINKSTSKIEEFATQISDSGISLNSIDLDKVNEEALANKLFNAHVKDIVDSFHEAQSNLGVHIQKCIDVLRKENGDHFASFKIKNSLLNEIVEARDTLAAILDETTNLQESHENVEFLNKDIVNDFYSKVTTQYQEIFEAVTDLQEIVEAVQVFDGISVAHEPKNVTEPYQVSTDSGPVGSSSILDTFCLEDSIGLPPDTMIGGLYPSSNSVQPDNLKNKDVFEAEPQDSSDPVTEVTEDQDFVMIPDEEKIENDPPKVEAVHDGESHQAESVASVNPDEELERLVAAIREGEDDHSAQEAQPEYEEPGIDQRRPVEESYVDLLARLRRETTVRPVGEEPIEKEDAPIQESVEVKPDKVAKAEVVEPEIEEPTDKAREEAISDFPEPKENEKHDIQKHTIEYSPEAVDVHGNMKKIDRIQSAIAFKISKLFLTHLSYSDTAIKDAISRVYAKNYDREVIKSQTVSSDPIVEEAPMQPKRTSADPRIVNIPSTTSTAISAIANEMKKLISGSNVQDFKTAKQKLLDKFGFRSGDEISGMKGASKIVFDVISVLGIPKSLINEKIEFKDLQKRSDAYSTMTFAEIENIATFYRTRDKKFIITAQPSTTNEFQSVITVFDALNGDPKIGDLISIKVWNAEVPLVLKEVFENQDDSAALLELLSMEKQIGEQKESQVVRRLPLPLVIS